MYKTIILFSLVFSCLFSCTQKTQTISMYFPHFTGKKYDFIIFQGGHPKTIYQGTIPQDGKFVLTIPKEYAPYTGMSRWLITGTTEGGGLDMFIPGTDFSVSCESSQPNESNIIYADNGKNKEFNRLYSSSNDILERYRQALSSAATDELGKQKEAYASLSKGLSAQGDYISQLTQICNVEAGFGTHLLEKEHERAANVADFIRDQLNWETLYTSGHWNAVIDSWLYSRIDVLKDPTRFTSDFQKIASRIKSPLIFTELAQDIASRLVQRGDDDYIGYIAKTVVSSGKITAFDGPLAFYIKGTVGSVAPDLVFKTGTSSKSNKMKKRTISINASGKDFVRTILIFYQSDDPNSMETLKQLSTKYKTIKASGTRVIALSADSEEKIFNSKIHSFPWLDTYCDYQGVKGENFQSYGITGVPTLFLIDAEGKILSRGGSINF
ncbi:thioredoxin family protein [Sphingobacterium sp. ML3W]|uniref:peroxiredoxin family protein n=2 Tax=Sphingobacterium sp. ML3W TaxID=1538644 RepID=UPI002499F710|nr:thioredoxin family protein [Sphingobacterium sp. ML3W]WFA82176.1 thioredoxin family protein [Sphingobacterium sp. ML3W]